jgi:trans-aconitate methyltransferase
MNPLISIPQVKDVCDFGYGAGNYIKHFGELCPEKRYYGVDISSSMIERARTLSPFAEFAAASM